LPERRLACVGKHVRGRSALVSLRVLPALVAARGAEEGPSALERTITDFVRDHGPCSTADLPGLIGYERKPVAAAVDRLQRRLILTTAGAQERPQGWPAVVVDLLARRYADYLDDVPDQEAARVELADLVLASAGELSAADLAAVVGITRKEAGAALDLLVEHGTARQQDEEGFALYRRSRRRAS
jgi:Winged helix DNA-binding domain